MGYETFAYELRHEWARGKSSRRIATPFLLCRSEGGRAGLDHDTPFGLLSALRHDVTSRDGTNVLRTRVSSASLKDRKVRRVFVFQKTGLQGILLAV